VTLLGLALVLLRRRQDQSDTTPEEPAADRPAESDETVGAAT
jgi:hypothetical protein